MSSSFFGGMAVDFLMSLNLALILSAVNTTLIQATMITLLYRNPVPNLNITAIIPKVK